MLGGPIISSVAEKNRLCEAGCGASSIAYVGVSGFIEATAIERQKFGWKPRKAGDFGY